MPDIKMDYQNNQLVIQNFMNVLKNSSNIDFVRGMLFCFGAPTIKGIKSACLINLKRNSEDIKNLWTSYAGKWLEPYNIENVLLNKFSASKNALVLIFRRTLLKRALSRPAARELLLSYNYPVPNVDACLKHLTKKFAFEIPHEVGIFLDYPAEDVKGFIENRQAGNLLSKGYWKVYGNVERAGKIFKRYKTAEYDAALNMLTSWHAV